MINKIKIYQLHVLFFFNSKFLLLGYTFKLSSKLKVFNIPVTVFRVGFVDVNPKVFCYIFYF